VGQGQRAGAPLPCHPCEITSNCCWYHPPSFPPKRSLGKPAKCQSPKRSLGKLAKCPPSDHSANQPNANPPRAITRQPAKCQSPKRSLGKLAKCQSPQAITRQTSQIYSRFSPRTACMYPHHLPHSCHSLLAIATLCTHQPPAGDDRVVLLASTRRDFRSRFH